MQLTGSPKQIEFASAIVEAITSKHDALNAEIPTMEKGPGKNHKKSCNGVISSYVGAFQVCDAIISGDLANAENIIEAMPSDNQEHAIEISNKLANSSDIKSVDAGNLIETCKGIFYNITKKWNI